MYLWASALPCATQKTKRARLRRLSLVAPKSDGAYWPRPPEMLQNTFLTWLPRRIRTTMTTTAINTRIRAYSTIPCPSSRLNRARRRRYRLVNMDFTSRFGDWSQSDSAPGTTGRMAVHQLPAPGDDPA